jgi:hypothetical protein
MGASLPPHGLHTLIVVKHPDHNLARVNHESVRLIIEEGTRYSPIPERPRSEPAPIRALNISLYESGLNVIVLNFATFPI